MLDIPSSGKAILMKPYPNEETVSIDYRIQAVIEIKSTDQTIRYNNSFYEYAGVTDGYAIYNYISSIEES